MKDGYIVLGALVFILAIVVVYLIMSKPTEQPIVIVENESPTWIPWTWGRAQNPGTTFISRPVPHFYPRPHHFGSHPAISTGPHRPSLPMPQTPAEPPSQPARLPHRVMQ
jgi:hypothetical protein